MAVWGRLTDSCEKKRSERQRRKEKEYAEFQRIARRDKEDFLSDQYKETEENNRIAKTIRQLEIPREYFMQRWAR